MSSHILGLFGTNAQGLLKKLGIDLPAAENQGQKTQPKVLEPTGGTAPR